MSFEDAIQTVKADAQERNFTQSVDLIINLRNLDLNDPDNRISEDITVPYPADDDIAVCVIGETIIQHAENADRVVDPDELDELIGDEDAAKELVESYDFFLAEAPLMPTIGKELGSIMGPRNKMPSPVQPGEDPSEQIERLRSTISIQLKESPSIKCKIGNEDMGEQELADNADAVYSRIVDNLPQREHNLKDVLVKLTMSSPVKVN